MADLTKNVKLADKNLQKLLAYLESDFDNEVNMKAAKRITEYEFAVIEYISNLHSQIAGLLKMLPKNEQIQHKFQYESPILKFK
jgi:hypothetical protein